MNDPAASRRSEQRERPEHPRQRIAAGLAGSKAGDGDVGDLVLVRRAARGRAEAEPAVGAIDLALPAPDARVVDDDLDEILTHGHDHVVPLAVEGSLVIDREQVISDRAVDDAEVVGGPVAAVVPVVDLDPIAAVALPDLTSSAFVETEGTSTARLIVAAFVKHEDEAVRGALAGRGAVAESGNEGTSDVPLEPHLTEPPIQSGREQDDALGFGKDGVVL